MCRRLQELCDLQHCHHCVTALAWWRNARCAARSGCFVSGCQHASGVGCAAESCKEALQLAWISCGRRRADRSQSWGRPLAAQTALCEEKFFNFQAYCRMQITEMGLLLLCWAVHKLWDICWNRQQQNALTFFSSLASKPGDVESTGWKCTCMRFVLMKLTFDLNLLSCTVFQMHIGRDLNYPHIEYRQQLNEWNLIRC